MHFLKNCFFACVAVEILDSNAKLDIRLAWILSLQRNDLHNKVFKTTINNIGFVNYFDWSN